jgi:AraC-like DNA-binding protein
MLKECPELTIAEIAEKSGFQSASHFIRLFKEKEECSPARWRKK